MVECTLPFSANGRNREGATLAAFFNVSDLERFAINGAPPRSASVEDQRVGARAGARSRSELGARPIEAHLGPAARRLSKRSPDVPRAETCGPGVPRTLGTEEFPGGHLGSHRGAAWRILRRFLGISAGRWRPVGAAFPGRIHRSPPLGPRHDYAAATAACSTTPDLAHGITLYTSHAGEAPVNVTVNARRPAVNVTVNARRPAVKPR